jgi:hypothetical protein
MAISWLNITWQGWVKLHFAMNKHPTMENVPIFYFPTETWEDFSGCQV